MKAKNKPSVYGLGIVAGEKTRDEFGNVLLSYNYWSHMIKRVSHKFEDVNYKNVGICEEWKHYKIFKKWFDENYYEVDNQKMEIDKDIVIKGNKIYSPETCVFVPQNINVLFTKRNALRGDLPIGVSWHKLKNKYQSRCNNKFVSKNQIHLGYFDSPTEAFQVYKIYKENLIKYIANFYKNNIPSRLYESMCGYVVEIDD